MTNRVVVTGVGVISSLGDTPSAIHTALCDGHSSLQAVSHPDLPTDGYLGGPITDFNPQTYLGDKNFRPLDRASQLTVSAVHLALAASGWSPERREENLVGLVLGTMFCSVRTIAEFDRRAITLGPSYAKPLDFANTVINAASGQTAIWHKLRGINSTISTGLSSGLQAIGYACDLIRTGRADQTLAGGVEELCFESLYGFARANLLAGDGQSSSNACSVPFDKRRNGFFLGEAAAFLMLENRETAVSRGATILAELKGYGTAYDPSGGRTDQAAQAIAMAQRSACQSAEIDPSEIDFVSASANGSPNMDRYEAQATAEVFGARSGQLRITAIKALLGECLGASGALQTIDAIQTMQEGTLPGIHGLEQTETEFPSLAFSGNQKGTFRLALINSINYDGHCCSLVVQR